MGRLALLVASALVPASTAIELTKTNSTAMTNETLGPFDDGIVPGQAQDQDEAAVLGEAFRVFVVLWSQIRLLRLWSSVLRSNKDRFVLATWLRGGAWSGQASGYYYGGLCGLLALVGNAGAALYPCGATLGLSCAGSLAVWWQALPYDVDNATSFENFMNMNFAAGVVSAWARGLPAHEVFWAETAPAGRLLLCLLLFGTGFAKLNWDFLDVRKSSSSVLSVFVLEWYGGLLGFTSATADWVGDSAILALHKLMMVLTIVFELVAPALLALPSVSCVYLGMLMNWVSMLWIGLLAGIFAALSVGSLTLWAAPADLVLHLSFMTTAPAATAAMALLLCVLFSPLAMPWTYPTLDPSYFLCLLYMLALCPMLWYNAVAQATSPPTMMNDFSFFSVSGIVVAASAFNILCPYIGLRTHCTYTMFSNLDVEGGRSNHLFMPACLQLFGFCRDTVTVWATDSETLRVYHLTLGQEAETLKILRSFCLRTGTHTLIHAISGPERGASTLIHAQARVGTATEGTIFPFTTTFCDLRRIITAQLIPAGGDFYVDYERHNCGRSKTSSELAAGLIDAGDAAGPRRRFEWKDGDFVPGSDPQLAKQLPLAPVLNKLAWWRSKPLEDPGVCCR